MGEHKKPHVGYLSRFPPQLMPKKSQDQSEDQFTLLSDINLKGHWTMFSTGLVSHWVQSESGQD